MYVRNFNLAGLYLLKKDVSYLIGVATSGFARHGSNNQSNLIMQFVSLKGIGDHLAKVAGKYLCFYSVRSSIASHRNCGSYS